MGSKSNRTIQNLNIKVYISTLGRTPGGRAFRNFSMACLWPTIGQRFFVFFLFINPINGTSHAIFNYLSLLITHGHSSISFFVPFSPNLCWCFLIIFFWKNHNLNHLKPPNITHKKDLKNITITAPSFNVWTIGSGVNPSKSLAPQIVRGVVSSQFTWCHK